MIDRTNAAILPTKIMGADSLSLPSHALRALRNVAPVSWWNVPAAKENCPKRSAARVPMNAPAAKLRTHYRQCAGNLMKH